MKEIRFPYLRYIVTPPTEKPAKYVYRPVIPIKLFLNKKVITFDGLIDSGADECTFPGWIAKALGYNVYKGRQKIFSGIGGSVLAYLHKTHLSLMELNSLRMYTIHMSGMICHLVSWDREGSLRTLRFISIIRRKRFY